MVLVEPETRALSSFGRVKSDARGDEWVWPRTGVTGVDVLPAGEMPHASAASSFERMHSFATIPTRVDHHQLTDIGSWT